MRIKSHSRGNFSQVIFPQHLVDRSTSYSADNIVRTTRAAWTFSRAVSTRVKIGYF